MRIAKVTTKTTQDHHPSRHRHDGTAAVTRLHFIARPKEDAGIRVEFLNRDMNVLHRLVASNEKATDLIITMMEQNPTIRGLVMKHYLKKVEQYFAKASKNELAGPPTRVMLRILKKA